MSQTQPTSPRDGLLAFAIAKPDADAGCTPLPCPDCPVPGVFVAKMGVGQFIRYREEVEAFDPKADDSPAAKEAKRKARAAVQLRYAAVDAEGRQLLRAGDPELTADAFLPLVSLFFQVNGMSEKKSAAGSGPQDG